MNPFKYGSTLSLASRGAEKLDGKSLVELLELVFDNPGDTQELCNCLWEVTPTGTTLSHDHLESALSLIFAREIRYFEQVLESITPIQKKCLHGIAALNGEGVYSNRFSERTGIHNTGTITKSIKRRKRSKSFTTRANGSSLALHF